MKQIPDQLQRQIWATEQEILDVIHQVCTEYGLRYSLAYGTLIGAVRHKGFIPWDDDIDLIMPREDYEKLLAIWNEAAPKGYILQNTRTDPDFTQNFTKSTRHFPACSHNFPKAGEARFQGRSRLFRLLGKLPYLGESRRILMAVSSKTSSKTRFCYAATRRISSAAVQPSIWA